MLKLLDLLAILALAVVVLLPAASIEARPALDGAPLELDRIAELQDDLARNPEDVEAALRLADGFLSYFRADFAIATLSRFEDLERRGRIPKDARLHRLLAMARAERLEAKEAVEQARMAEAACAGAEGTPRCPPGTPARIQLVHDAMRGIVELGIDPVREPQRAKMEVYRALHVSRPGFPP